MSVVATALVLAGFSCGAPTADLTIRLLEPLATTAHTGEKPQSKVWRHGDRWWMVLPDSTGTHLWRLDDRAWQHTGTLSARTDVTADCLPFGDSTFVLLFAGPESELAVLAYDAEASPQATYRRLDDAGTSMLPLAASAETATVARDGPGRLWVASDDETTIDVHYADFPYRAWSTPITVASGVAPDDVAAITALPDGRVGVFWSDQNRRRFGFRLHPPGSDPEDWSADEVPAGRFARDVGGGMSDDHLNFAVASDGTLYAAVKTSYDRPGETRIGLLVRRSSGDWDDLYHVDAEGTRPIVLLDEAGGRVFVVYTNTERGGAIVYRESPTDSLRFGERKVLLTGDRLNNVSSTKQTGMGGALVIASTATEVLGSVLAPD